MKEGCTRLILGDLNLDSLQKVSDELKAMDETVQTACVRVDVTSEVDVDEMITQGVSAFGAIHYAVNNAGITSRVRVRTHELPTECFDEVVNVDLKGVWLCQRAVLRQMLKQECILEMRHSCYDAGGAWHR